MADSSPQILHPVDVLRTTRSLAPHDSSLNDQRWLVSQSLIRLYDRGQFGLRALDYESIRNHASSVGSDLTVSVIDARKKMVRIIDHVGPSLWPILFSIVLSGRSARECRHLVPEVVWALSDAVVIDRLRISLDLIRETLGVPIIWR
jgi:hypothetical protein